MTSDKDQANRERTRAATAASKAAAARRRVEKAVKLLEAEGFVVTLAPKG